VDDLTICLLMAACDLDSLLAHRSHALRSGPGENRSQIARRSVMRAARRIPLESHAGSVVRGGCHSGESGAMVEICAIHLQGRA
jgi:hypothetical protein